MVDNKRGLLNTYVYSDDSGTDHSVQLTEAVAAAGGFEPGDGTDPPLPRGFKMRRVGLWDPSTNKRASIPWSDLNAGYTEPGSVTLDGVSMKAVGRTGEKARKPHSRS
jgi:hypothetical protein